jgi:hypothetical protein
MIDPPHSITRWMLDVLLEPGAVMRRMSGQPPVVSFFVAGSILSGALSWANLSVNERAMARLLADGVPSEVAEQSSRDLNRKKLVRVAGAPAQLVLDASAGAIALFAGSCSIGGARRFRSLGGRSCAAAAIAAETPQLLSRTVDLETLWNEGPEITLELRPLLRSSTSAGAFLSLDGQPIAIQEAAEEISLFTMWSAALAGVALRELSEASRKKAILFSCAALLLRAGIAAAVGFAVSEIE